MLSLSVSVKVVSLAGPLVTSSPRRARAYADSAVTAWSATYTAPTVVWTTSRTHPRARSRCINAHDARNFPAYLSLARSRRVCLANNTVMTGLQTKRRPHHMALTVSSLAVIPRLRLCAALGHIRRRNWPRHRLSQGEPDCDRTGDGRNN